MDNEVLLTLKLRQQIFADPKRIKLLKQIVQTGSISQGAKLAGISYKSAWDAIHDMNELAEHLIVERSTGGKGGGGAKLTPYGLRLIQLYDLLTQIQDKAFHVLNQDTLPLDSLLAAISRFSLQTSARNQLFGYVKRITEQEVICYVEIQLINSAIYLTAAITRSSLQRLHLVPNKEVLALIKAPWIALTTVSPSHSDNQLVGTICQIQSETHHSEVQLLLASGEQLSITLPTSQLEQLQLTLGKQAYASFQAESVIIASLT